MSPRRMFRSRAGWASAAAVLVVAGVLAGTMLADAAGPPLPKRTPAQLLVAMRSARPPAAMTAVITENANLGFPSLPNIPGLQSSLLSGASFITGTHTFDIWYDGPRHVRIAVPVSFGETDFRVNGNQAWLWDSHGQMATHYILPAHPALRVGIHAKPVKGVRLRLFFGAHPSVGARRCLVAVRQRLKAHPAAVARTAVVKCFKGLKIARQVPANFKPLPSLTPQQAATKFLAALGPTTKVTVAGSTVVAGRSAYQLVIAPRTSQSLISQIVIAVDAKTYLPLQLQVFARGTSGAAFQIGFTSLTFGKPAASNFTFTPPAGAHVKTEKLAAGLPGLMGPLSMGGLPAPLPGPFTSQRFLPKSAVPAPALARVKGMIRIGKVRWAVVRPLNRVRAFIRAIRRARKSAVSPPRPVIMPASPLGVAPAAASGVKVLGSGWLSVAVLPIGNSLPGVSPAPVKSAAGTKLAIPAAGSARAAQMAALLRILLNSAAHVRGAWGSGRLIRTSLFSALATNNGKLLIGAVTPAVLYADAAKVK